MDFNIDPSASSVLSCLVKARPTVETALMGSTAQASVLVMCCARTVMSLERNKGGFRGLPQPKKFSGFFKKSTDPHED